MRRRTLLAAIIICGVIVGAGHRTTHAQGAPDAAAVSASLAEAASAAGGVATAFDTDGVPTFIRGSGQSVAAVGVPEIAARQHLGRFARAFKVLPSDLATARLVGVHEVSSGGAIAHFRQQIDGLDVYGSDVKVLLGTDGRLVAISGRPHATGGAQPAFGVSSEQALAGALSDLTGVRVAPSSLLRKLARRAGDPAAPNGVEWLQFVDPRGRLVAEPAPVKKILVPVAGALIAAYDVQFYLGIADSNDSAAFRYLVAAADGRVLQRRDLTASDQHGPHPPEFQYRVWADADGDKRPHDGPTSDFTPHPTGTPDDSTPPFVPPNLVSVSGLNDPRNNHRSDKSKARKADPWLPADATETSGNNVDAYADHSAPDGLSAGDFRAPTNGQQTFDWTYDTSAGPLATVEQSNASIVQAFYTVNWLHDYWYDSGFSEAAGNAQADNYGRGGIGGDAMLVEIQDDYFGGRRNNANMSTPADGIPPRMQMYVWRGRETSALTLMPGGERATRSAGISAATFDFTAPVVLANDGTATTTDACEPLVANATGQIVVVDLGGTGCSFVLKAEHVQAAGAVGVIFANTQPGPPRALGGSPGPNPIAVLSISDVDGAALKAALAAGSVSARMFRAQETERDSGLDNQVIAHEWGHYLHHRLAECGTWQCAALSEGWGDFLTLHLSARDGDDLDGTYSGSVYAARHLTDNGYYGTRRAPYSVDFTKNGLTFKHISDGEPLPDGVLPTPSNSEVHSAGEIWASMLWEAYVALLKSDDSRSGFDRVRRRMSEYVVAGLQMTPPDATYTEQRDAILAAVAAGRDQRTDFGTMAAAFARRGAGSCAISPPRESETLVGVTESYDVKPRLAIGEVTVDDGQFSGKHDGRVSITVLNDGGADAVDTVVTLTSPSAGISFPRGNTVRIRRIGPFESATVSIRIAPDPAVIAPGGLDLEVSVANGEACVPSVTRSLAQPTAMTSSGAY